MKRSPFSLQRWLGAGSAKFHLGTALTRKRAPSPGPSPVDSPFRPVQETLADHIPSPRSAGSVRDWMPPSPEKLSELLPQYRVEELIGRGGMGAVYRATQLVLERPVAIKILPAEMAEQEFLVRFQREARMLAKLQHPGIVGIYDFGQTREGQLYLAMEFVDGQDLAQMLRSHSLTPSRALDLTVQICESLQYAHSQGVIHRDVKPANILVTQDGRAKLADFGLARPMGDTPGTLMVSLVVRGTPDYMAPEQREGRADNRADIYSLGVLLYEMLTGRRPKGVFDPPSIKVQVDARLDQVVIRALQQEPDRRYQHVSEMKTDVERIRDTPGESKEITAPIPSEEPIELERCTRRRPAKRSVILTLAAALALLAAAHLFSWHHSTQRARSTSAEEIAASAPWNGNPDLSAGLISWWKADGDAHDSTGTHHATLVGNVSFGPGIDGQAFLLSGSGGYLSVPNSRSWAFGKDDFSIALWAKYLSSDLSAKTFLACDDGPGNPNKWIFWSRRGLIEWHGAGALRFNFNPSDGAWYHIALARIGPQFRFYIDGSIAHSGSWPGEVPQAKAPLTIGSAEGGNCFNGLLDDIRIYNRALAPAEIQALAETPGSAKTTSLPDSSEFETLSLSETPGTATRGDSPFIDSLHFHEPSGIRYSHYGFRSDPAPAPGVAHSPETKLPREKELPPLPLPSVADTDVPAPAEPVLLPAPKPVAQPDTATRIAAEYAKFDPNTNVLTYEENVELVHGEFNLQCQVLVAELTPAHPLDRSGAYPTVPFERVRRAIAKGYVIVRRVAPGGRMQVAKSREAIYDGESGDIVLSDFPQLQDGKDLIQAAERTTKIYLRKTGKYEVKGPAEYKSLPEEPRVPEAKWFLRG